MDSLGADQAYVLNPLSLLPLPFYPATGSPCSVPSISRSYQQARAGGNCGGPIGPVRGGACLTAGNRSVAHLVLMPKPCSQYQVYQ